MNDVEVMTSKFESRIITNIQLRLKQSNSIQCQLSTAGLFVRNHATLLYESSPIASLCFCFSSSSPGSTAHFGRMFRIALRKFKNDDDRHLSGSEPLVAVDLDGQTLQQLYEVRVKSAMGLNH